MNNKVVFLLLSFSFCLCQVAPVKGQAIDDDLFDQLGVVNEALYVMQLVEEGSLCQGSISECLNIEFPAGQKALCYVYDRYLHYSQNLLSITPDSPLFATMAANKFVAWKNLNSTCDWVQLNTTSTLSTCTVPEIGQVCTMYRLHEHKREIRPLLDGIVRRVNALGRHVRGVSESDWLQSNLTPEPKSITSTLVDTIGCSVSEGVFSC